MTTPRQQRLARFTRNRPAVVVAVSALVIAVALAVVTTRPSDATEAASSHTDNALTDIQSAQRGANRADRGKQRTALPSTSTLPSAAVDAKPTTPVTPKPTSRPTATTEAAKAAKAPAALPTVVGHRFTTTALKVRAAASTSATVRKVIPRGTRIGITGTSHKTWTRTVIDGKAAWVSAAYLSKTRPKPLKASSGSTSSAGTRSHGFSTAACPTGSSVESGLTPNAVRIHRAACASFPSVRRYGGIGPTGEHAAGRAVDIMVSGSSLGNAISAWARSNAGALHISEVVWSQHIWTVQRSSQGWRSMPDRGSATANHYDHVHVTVY